MSAGRTHRHTGRWLPLAVALLAAGAVACEPKPYVGPTTGPRLALVGDSLLAQIEQEGNDRFVAEGWSASLSGFTGFSTAESYDTVVKAVATGPRVLVVELGTNDVDRIGAGTLDLADFASDVRATIDAAAPVPCLVWVGVETTHGVIGSTQMSALGPSVDQAIVAALTTSGRAPGTTFYADWATASAGQPELFDAPTDVHHSELGRHAFLDLIDRSIRSCPGNPIVGTFEQAGAGLGTVTVAGWAADPDAPSSLVAVRLDGLEVAVVRADGERIDVATVAPWLGPRRGFAATVAAVPGRHEVCVTALNTGPPGADLELGCRWVTVPADPPGVPGSPSATPGTLPEPVWPVGFLPSRWELTVRA